MDKIYIKYVIRTDVEGSDCTATLTFDKDDWNSMTEQEQFDEIKDFAYQHLDFWYEEVDSEDC